MTSKQKGDIVGYITIGIIAAGAVATFFLWHYGKLAGLLPYWGLLPLSVITGYMYYYGEGTCQGYTFRADDILFEIQEGMNTKPVGTYNKLKDTELWRIDQFRYKLHRMAETIGASGYMFGLIVLCKSGYSAWHFAGYLLPLIPCYWFGYKRQLKKMWEL